MAGELEVGRVLERDANSSALGDYSEKFSDCETCLDIWRYFVDVHIEDVLVLGYHMEDELLSKCLRNRTMSEWLGDKALQTCPRHTPLMENFKRPWSSERPTEVTIHSGEQAMGITLHLEPCYDEQEIALWDNPQSTKNGRPPEHESSDFAKQDFSLDTDEAVRTLDTDLIENAMLPEKDFFNSSDVAKKHNFDDAAGIWGHDLDLDFQNIQTLTSDPGGTDLLLVKQDSVPNHAGIGRVLDPDWMDLDILKGWKNLCVSSHGSRCENPLKIRPTRPAWLIDTKNKCVVRGRDCGVSEFVALSYRWGMRSGLQASTENITKLQLSNALESPEFSVHVAPSIRHAMYLTSVMGERYLWADALCIVHGDDAALTEQLNLMGAIFASALVTIVATDGDSQDGIMGLRNISPSRRLVQNVIPFGDEKIIVDQVRGWTLYETRGWVYQEYQMSKRRIIINEKQLWWECQCSMWCEHTVLGVELSRYQFSRDLDSGWHLMLAGFLDMAALGYTVLGYNSRNFSYEEDALPGISGLVSILSRSFTHGFLCGLPEMLFDQALGWRGGWMEEACRRAPSNRPVGKLLSLPILPSWSWIGWNGRLIFESQEASHLQSGSSDIVTTEIIPITEWFTSSTSSGSPKRRIRSTWFENRETFRNPNTPLPPGWSREKAPPDKYERPNPDWRSDWVFRHCNMPDVAWYYPFPVTEIREATPPCIPEQTPYIFCETKWARVWARYLRPPPDDILYEKKLQVKLCNKFRNIIGHLDLQNTDQRKLSPTTKHLQTVHNGGSQLIWLQYIGLECSDGAAKTKTIFERLRSIPCYG